MIRFDSWQWRHIGVTHKLLLLLLLLLEIIEKIDKCKKNLSVVAEQYATSFRCQSVNLLITYLGYEIKKCKM